MNPKENPDPRAEDFSQSSFRATPEKSHTTTAQSSRKTTPAEKPREPKPGTQRGISLNLLRSRPGGWVAVSEMMREARCAAVHTVISELRQRYGFKITNRQRRAKDGRRLSEYQLEEEAE